MISTGNAELDSHSIKILEVRKLVVERDEARNCENFERSDFLRQKLLNEFSVQLFDQKNGPTGWKFTDGSSNKLKAGLKIPVEMQPIRNLKRKLKEDDSKVEVIEEKKNKKQQTTLSLKGKPDGKALYKQFLCNQVKKDVKSSDQLRNSAMLHSLQSSSSSSSISQGVKIEDVIVGSGRKVTNGDRVKVGYVGRLKLTNKVFDSSLNKPFVFRVGRGEVIKGWDIGIQDMKVGGKRILTIPPEKAYGKTGAPPKIPSNAVLVFELSLTAIL